MLAKFNDQLRRNPAAEPGSRVERDEHLTRVISAGDGWNGVLWSDLAGLDPAGADAMIAAEVRRFTDLGRPWEWKYYSYDQPADLPGRLATVGPGQVVKTIQRNGYALQLSVSPNKAAAPAANSPPAVSTRSRGQTR